MPDNQTRINTKPSRPEKTAAQKRPPKKITENYLFNAGQFYLERFCASTAHFKRVMDRKIKKSCTAHPEQDYTACHALLDKAIERLKTAGFLNDEAFLEGLTYSFKNRGLPYNQIYSRLLKKGFTSAQIQTVLEKPDEEDNMRAAIIWLKKKRRGPYATKQSDKQKDLAAMARAGFSFATASKALDFNEDDNFY